MRSPVPPRMLALSILVVTASTLPVFLLGAAFVQMGPEFGFGPRGLGYLTGAFFLTSAATSAPLGRLVHRIGWRRAVRINAVASGTLAVAIGAGARDLPVLVAMLIGAASVYGLANPAANQLLASYGDPRRRALTFGLKHAGIPSSSLLAGLAVPVLVVTVGWRWAYVAAGFVAVLVWFLVPNRLPEAGRTGARDDAGRPLSTGQLVALAASSAFATWGPVALSTFVVAASVDRGFSESAAGLLLFAGSGASIGARVVAGQVTDRRSGRGFAAFALLAGTGAGIFLLMGPAPDPAFAGLVLVAFATGWAWPGLMTFIVVNANLGTVAASSSITQAGVFLGAGAGPLIQGFIVGRYGFGAAWLAAAAGLAVATVGVASVGARSGSRLDPAGRSGA